MSKVDPNRCVDCHVVKDSCQIDVCFSCAHPLCEWCALDNEGMCKACLGSDDQQGEDPNGT